MDQSNTSSDNTHTLYTLYNLYTYVPISAFCILLICFIPELCRFSNWQIKRRNLAI